MNDDLVKRLRDGCNLQQRDGERAADRIEQLERELVEAAERYTLLAQTGTNYITVLESQLSAERALADQLYHEHHGGDWQSAAEAYRKARGLA